MNLEKHSNFKKKIFWINPHKINLFSAPPNWWWYARIDKRLKNARLKKIIKKFAIDKLYYGGGWDLNSILFTDTDWSKNIKSLLPNYNNFQISNWYKSIQNEIKVNGFYKYKKTLIFNEEQINFFFENSIIKLIKSVMNNGFIIKDKSSDDIPKALISRKGDLIKSGNGCHRLAIIKELNLQKKYPVQIIGIHKKFNIGGVYASSLNCIDINNFVVNKYQNF